MPSEPVGGECDPWPLSTLLHHGLSYCLLLFPLCGSGRRGPEDLLPLQHLRPDRVRIRGWALPQLPTYRHTHTHTHTHTHVYTHAHTCIDIHFDVVEPEILTFWFHAFFFLRFLIFLLPTMQLNHSKIYTCYARSKYFILKSFISSKYYPDTD